MKKVISFLFVLLFLFSMTACAKNDPPKPEKFEGNILVEGNELTFQQFYDEICNNDMAFKYNYKGKNAVIKGKVSKIGGSVFQTNLNHQFNANIEVEGEVFAFSFFVDAGSDKVAMQFKVGDIVEVSGTLSSIIGDSMPTIYMYGPNTITKVE